MKAFLKRLIDSGDTHEAKVARKAIREVFDDNQLIEKIINPFTFAVISINFLMVLLILAMSPNFHSENWILQLLILVFGPISMSLLTSLVYLYLNDCVFIYFAGLKRTSSNPDSFPKMLWKVLISCLLTYIAIYLFTLF